MGDGGVALPKSAEDGMRKGHGEAFRVTLLISKVYMVTRLSVGDANDDDDCGEWHGSTLNWHRESIKWNWSGQSNDGGMSN